LCPPNGAVIGANNAVRDEYYKAITDEFKQIKHYRNNRHGANDP
jgi:hypothetical protein